MKRIMLLLALLGVLFTTPTLAAETYFGFQIGIGSAPPPPTVYFREAPEVVFVPGSRVYVVQDSHDDMFRHGRYWYVTRGGYWYRARSHHGPFRVIDVRRVPRAIFYVPAEHWKSRRWPGGRGRDRDWDRDRRSHFGFHVSVMNAPPPPRLYFPDRPELVYVPESQVYVVRDADYDMFRFGDSWYVARDGYWYRSQSYRGPFRVVDALSVPEPIYYVPAQHWKRHPQGGPPDGRRVRDRGRDRDRDHGRDRDPDRDGSDD